MDDLRFLMEQMAFQWEEILEERFACRIDLEACGRTAGTLDVGGLWRIMDNLASNVEKYADPNRQVELTVSSRGMEICLVQRNGIREGALGEVESH